MGYYDDKSVDKWYEISKSSKEYHAKAIEALETDLIAVSSAVARYALLRELDRQRAEYVKSTNEHAKWEDAKARGLKYVDYNYAH